MPTPYYRFFTLLAVPVPYAVLSLASVAALSFSVHAYSATKAMGSWVNAVARSNRVSPLETAAAHSPYRFYAGAGVKMAAVLPEENAQGDSPLNLPHAKKPNNLAIPQAWLSTGLAYPLDMGLSYGHVGDGPISQGGAYLQWTVYEGFARPAAAIRATVGRTFGLATTEVAALGVQMLTSWGYRLATLYAGIGGEYLLIRHHAAGSPAQERPAAVGHGTFTRMAGLHLQLIPAFFYAVADLQADSDGGKTLTFKLGVEI